VFTPPLMLSQLLKGTSPPNDLHLSMSGGLRNAMVAIESANGISRLRRCRTPEPFLIASVRLVAKHTRAADDRKRCERPPQERIIILCSYYQWSMMIHAKPSVAAAHRRMGGGVDRGGCLALGSSRPAVLYA
jgi:hypothetical protein